jgi:hypothetical protein
MKIKGDKAFRRAAQAAPKSAEGARKAPCSSVCICVHLWLICFFFLCVLCVSVVKCPFSRPSAVSASLRCLPQNGSFLPDLPVLPVNLAFFPPWRRAFVVVPGNLVSKPSDSCPQSPVITTVSIAGKIVLDSSVQP